MLVSSRLPKNLWGEDLLAVYHVHNRIPSLKTKVSPYEVGRGRKPNLSYLRVWGCIAYCRVPDNKRNKLGPRAIKSVFLGYIENSKAYMLFDIDSNIIVESRDEKFFENKFLKDLEPIVDPTNGLEPLQNIGFFSSNKKKESDTSIEPRRSQRPRKETYYPQISYLHKLLFS